MTLSDVERRAMRRALERAATRLDEEARDLEAMLERRRKPHSDDNSAVIAQAWRTAARKLRTWAATLT